LSTVSFGLSEIDFFDFEESEFLLLADRGLQDLSATFSEELFFFWW